MTQTVSEIEAQTGEAGVVQEAVLVEARVVVSTDDPENEEMRRERGDWNNFLFRIGIWVIGAFIGLGFLVSYVVREANASSYRNTQTVALTPTEKISPCSHEDVESALLSVFESCSTTKKWVDIRNGEMVCEKYPSPGAMVIANYSWSEPTDVYNWIRQPKALQVVHVDSIENGVNGTVIVDLQFSANEECNLDEDASALFDMIP